MKYNPDGTIQEVPYWKDTVLEQIEPLSPYHRVEAETMAWGKGLKTDKKAEREIYVTKIDDADALTVRGVDFGKRVRNDLRLLWLLLWELVRLKFIWIVQRDLWLVN